MFDFLFKRAADQQPDPQAAPATPDTGAAAAASASRRDEQTRVANGLAGNEAGAVELILRSEFAGVRLAAAEHVVSQPYLEQVQQAMRNTDRRVAKLMQGRLDAIRYQQTEQQKAQACLDHAQRLLQDEKLTPNQVAELDREWKLVADAPSLIAPFEAARAALAARLEAQVKLQRTIIDAMAAVRQLPGSASREEAGQALERYTAAHADYQQAPEHNALPRHLLRDYAEALEQARAALAAPVKPAVEAAGAVAAAAGPGPAVASAATNADDSVGAVDAAHPAGSAAADPAAALATGAATASDAESASAPGAPARAPQKPAKQAAAPKETDKKFLETLDALEAALEHGLLHAAAEHDKWLKEHKTRLTHAQTERLTHVRAELKRLGDWARWGGNVSREELVKAVEELPALGLAMSELAKKVGSMRERWKSLDAVSGHAPKSLWERFDTACTTAYAPAAAHFKQLADERHANAAKAQALLAETQAMAAAAATSEADLKNVAAAGQRLRQVWGRLGTIDRKEKRKLDQAFDKALSQMLAPLSEQRKIETAKREQLIAEAEALQPSERHTLDKLRHLQERWQEQAKALPLERKAEQALWQRFRAACDAIFAKRKETAHAADHERKSHLHAREALCKELEEAVFSGDDKAQLAGIAQKLRDAATAWHAIGAVPRAAEPKINQRYHNAVAAVQAQADTIKRRAGAAQANALRDKLRLCQALESAIGAKPFGAATGTAAGNGAADAIGTDAAGTAADVAAGNGAAGAAADGATGKGAGLSATAADAAVGEGAAGAASDGAAVGAATDAAGWLARWAALPVLGGEYERALKGRFDAALAALDGADGKRVAYAEQLERNRAKLLDEVLRLEIVAGVDSGAEFARERLKMQVEVLQSSLKSGQKPQTASAAYLQLCAMPALADARTTSRIEQLFRRIGAAERA
ncbi:DUF349 domain-containing protein [Duganella aceris]|uniref:DUF349 domain-containing protein n=1 Tax=Duganella aceris TaxID=2703883 RepID=A0ABX0FMF9_9BURK|nr:DUF349 domain-containing protein [Duganella aceris]NGZ85715.1 DUF349 domain-containing protein [Duganella aceris]